MDTQHTCKCVHLHTEPSHDTNAHTYTHKHTHTHTHAHVRVLPCSLHWVRGVPSDRGVGQGPASLCVSAAVRDWIKIISQVPQDDSTLWKRACNSFLGQPFTQTACRSLQSPHPGQPTRLSLGQAAQPK